MCADRWSDRACVPSSLSGLPVAFEADPLAPVTEQASYLRLCSRELKPSSQAHRYCIHLRGPRQESSAHKSHAFVRVQRARARATMRSHATQDAHVPYQGGCHALGSCRWRPMPSLQLKTICTQSALGINTIQVTAAGCQGARVMSCRGHGCWPWSPCACLPAERC